MGKCEWDKDAVKKENLHRNLVATKEMVGANKAEALAPTTRAVATAHPTEFEAIPGWVHRWKG